MKTHIIHLEQHDDINSTMDKMSWSKSARILLVLPEKERLIHSRLDVVQLQRRAMKIGAQLALVTPDAEVTMVARELGVPVFRFVSQAQKSPWRRRRKSRRLPLHRTQQYMEKNKLPEPVHRLPPRKTGEGVRLAAFGAAILSILALIGFFLPSAKIEIDRKRELQQLDLIVIASPETTIPSRSGAIPAYPLSVIVESSLEGVSTGKVIVPGEKARGVVRFTNLTDQMVTIPEGTVVQTVAIPHIRFQTDHQIVVPPDLNGYREVPVSAVEGGENGNVAAGVIVMIDNPTGVKISVSNPEPTSGGTNLSIPAPAQGDYSNLREALNAELPGQALNELQTKISEDMQIIPGSLILDSVENEVQDPQIGAPGDACKLTIRAKYTVLYVVNSDIQNVSNLALDAITDPGYQVIPDTLTIIPLAEPVFVNGRISWDLHLAREIVQNYSGETLAGSLVGLKPENASQILVKSFALEKDPLISISPSWFPFLPFLSFRIEVNWS